MKKFLLIISLVLSGYCLYSQTGPGGIGSSATNKLWLKADYITGLSNGDQVATWADASGNGNDLTQSTAGLRPLYYTNQANGFPAIYFTDNAGNYLIRNPFASFPSTTLTAVIVYKTNVAGNDAKISYASTASDNDFLLFNSSSESVYVRNVSSATGEVFNNNQYHVELVTWQSSGGNTKFFKDGDNTDNPNISSGQSITNNGALVLGQEQDAVGGGFDNAQDFPGYMTEVIIFNSVLNSAQCNILNNYLAAKYGVTMASNDFYSYESTHKYDVAGIGRENPSNVHSEAESANMLKISSPCCLGNNEYLLFGHNNGSLSWTSTEVPAADNNVKRISREWRFDETGDVGALTIQLDVTDLPAQPSGFSQYFMLVDADGDFSSGATFYPLVSAGGNIYEKTGFDISDGDFVTFALVRPVVQYSISSSSGDESVTPANLQLSLNYALVVDLTVDLAVNGASTATPGGGNDFTLPASPFTISAGNTTADVGLTINDDPDIEDDETAIVIISNPIPGRLGTRTSHTYTIQDNDNPRKIQFSGISAGNDESVNSYTVTVEINIADGSNPTSVNYTVSGGTATGTGIDYTLANGTATIDPGNTTTTFDIAINEDIVDESDETIIISISNPLNANLGTNRTFTYTIIDNDGPPVANFSFSTSSCAENTTPGSIEVKLSNISGQNVVVDYTVANGTATNGSDFSLANGSLTITPGNLIGSIKPVIIDDSDIEGGETFTVTLTGITGGSLGTLLLNTFTISDDDNDGYSGPGGVGNSDNNKLWLRASDISGVIDGDPVTTWPDVSGNSYDLSQSNPAFQPVFRTNIVNSRPVVRFNVDNNRLIRNPFEGIPTSAYSAYIVYKTADNNDATISYATTSDNNNLLFFNDANLGIYTAGNNIATGQAINDNSFHFVNVSWRNSDGRLKIYKEGSNMYSGTLSSGLSITSGGCLALGGEQDAVDGGYDVAQDFDGDIAEVIIYNNNLNSAQINIVDNYLAAKYGFTISNDLYSFEISHSYDVAGIGRENPSNTHTAAQSAGILKICSPGSLGNNEYLLFGHDNGAINAWTTNEIPSSGVNIKRIAREWRLDETGDVGTVTVSIDISTLAAPPSGYTNYYLMIDADGVFTSGATVYPLALVGGNVYEVAGINIADEDYVTVAVVNPIIQFTNLTSSEFEPNGPHAVQVSVNYPLGQNVSVSYTITGGTATNGGVDYNLANGTATITAGNTTTNINIPLVNDVILEDPETVTFMLSHPTGVNLGTNLTHTFTINDDDNARKINFAAVSSSGDESVTPVTVTVQINNIDGSNPTSVDYAVTGGTATGGGTDYLLSSGTATVTPGSGTTTFDIFINEDGLDESDETIIVTLTNPVNCNLATSNTTYTYTIIDNDDGPTVEFTFSASSCMENTTPGYIEVSLSAVSGLDVNVDFTVANVTALGNGVDYTLSSGTLTIPSGSQSVSLEAQIVNDSYLEGGETFTVTLSNPVGATLGAKTVNTFTISDDDDMGFTGPGGVGSASSNKLWVSADKITGLSNNDPLVTWPDRSGNSYNLTQSDPLYRPIYKTAQLNSQPAIDFSVANNRIVKNSFSDFPTSAITSYFVYKTADVNDAVISYATTSDNNNYLLFNSSNLTIYTAGNNLSTAQALNNNAWHIASTSWQNSNGNVKLFKDGSQIFNGTISSGLSMTAGGCLALGGEQDAVDGAYDAAQDLDGSLAEVIIYNYYVNTAQRIIIDNYLAAKYGFTSMPNDKYAYEATHPNDVAGIGQVDASNKHTAAQSAGIMKVSSPNGLGNGEYLLFGHDNGAINSWVTADAPGAGANIQRIVREWRFDETGEVGTVSFTVDSTLLPARAAGYSTYCLLVDADGTFASGAAMYMMTSAGGSNFQVTGVNINAGDFVTLAVVRPVLQFSTPTSGKFEPNGPGTATVSLNFPMSANVSANYTITGGTATSGSDYILSDGVVTITAGNTSTNINITLINDIIVESDETIIINLSNPSSGVTLGTYTVHTFSISDDDNLRKINYSVASSAGDESASPVSLTVQINTVDNDNPTTVDYSIDLSSTATGGGIDYTLASGTATVPAGSLTTTIDISIVDDAIDEPNETVKVNLSNPTNCNLASTNTLYTYTINDNDDAPTVQFSLASSNASESVASKNVEVSLTAVAGNDITVNYSVANVTATNGADFSLANGSVFIPAGNQTANIAVTIIDDVDIETDETFTITLSGPVGATLGAPDVHTVTINDNDNSGFVGPGGVGNSTNNKLWVKADAITGFSDGAALTTWIDKSGNSFDLTQPTTSVAPIYKTGIVNSLPVVRFNVNDNRIRKTGFAAFPTSQITSIMVVKTSDASDATISYATAADNNNYLLFNSSNLTIYSAGGNVSTGQSFNNNAWHIVTNTWRSSDGNVKLYKDATQVYTGTLATGASISAGGCLALGGEQDAVDGGYDPAQDYDGDMAEAIIYNQYINSAQRKIIENYLSAKYAISIGGIDMYAEGTYRFDVAGIGRDDASNFHTAAQSAGIVKISNPSSLDNSDYIFIGHNNDPVNSWTTTESPSASISRLQREWKVGETGEVGDIIVTLDTALLVARPAGFTTFLLLIDTDGDGDFTTGSPAIYPMTPAGGSLFELSGINLATNSYFTFASCQNSTKQSGNFNDPATWLAGFVPGATQQAIINTGHSVILASNQTVGNLFINNTGSLNLGTYSLTIDDGTITNNGSFNANTGTVVYSKAGAQNVAGLTYYNLTLDGSGTKTLSGNINVDGKLDINASGVTLDTKAGSDFSINLAGNWENDGSFTSQNGLVVFDGSGAQSISAAGTQTFYDLQVDKSANDLTLIRSIVANNMLTLTSGDIILGNYDLTIGSSGSISGGGATSYIQA
ncbi:MAG: hypothetical protein KKA07_10980, partial [Bacteroidetes bacterium]|nr:hypothetical protein [Bacteroidota bacterium]